MVARFALPAILLAALACHSPQAQPAQERARIPASVIHPSGAAWLERDSREREERPEIVIAAMNLKNGDVVADIGAGTGFYTRRLARAVAPDGVVYANDIQPELLTILREKAAAAQLTNVVPILGGETDPRLPQASLDWVLMVDVYHELQQPKPILEAIKRSLKPGGRVALVEYRETTTQIRPEHRMSKEQVLREWLPAGFRLLHVVEEMPLQRVYLFEVASE